MKQKPSFQFYTQDFLGSIDVQLMSAEEIGIYCLMLFNCVNNGGSLPNDATALSRLCRGIAPSAKVMEKFYVFENKLRNERVDQELRKQAKFSKDQTAKAKRRWLDAPKTPMPRHSHGTTAAMPEQSPRGQCSSTSTSNKEIINNPPSVKEFSDFLEIDKTKKAKQPDPRITAMIDSFKVLFDRTDFKEEKQWQRIYGRHLANLSEEIGKAEWDRRVTILCEDAFKLKNCNSLKFIYGEIKSVGGTNARATGVKGIKSF